MIYVSYLAIPGNGYSEAYSVCAGDNGNYVVAGLCRLADDVGPDQGFVTKLDVGSNQLWTAVFDSVLYDVQMSGSKIILFGAAEILVLDDAGNLLNQISTNSFIHDAVLFNNTFLLSNGSEVFIIDSIGNQISINSFSNVLALISVDTNLIAVVTENKLQLLDYNLNVVSSTPVPGNFTQASLVSEGGHFWIEAKDVGGTCSLLHFTDSLVLSYSLNLPVSIDNYHRAFFAVATNDSLIAVLGNESFGLQTDAAIKTFKKLSGESNPLGVDANLSSDSRTYLGYSADSIAVNFYITQYYYQYNVQIENLGSDTIRKISINGNAPGGMNCSFADFYLTLDNLLIAPSDLFNYSFPVTFSLGGLIAPAPFYNFNACLWLSSPNDSLDANLSDNYSCKLMTGFESGIVKTEINVFPNPAHDEVQLKLLSEQTFTLEIEDAAGHVLFKEIVKGNTTIDVGNYPQGYYVVTLSNKSSKLFKSLVIQ